MRRLPGRMIWEVTGGEYGYGTVRGRCGEARRGIWRSNRDMASAKVSLAEAPTNEAECTEMIMRGRRV